MPRGEAVDPVILADINVLLYAHREDAPNHERYRQWLERTVNGASPYGTSDLVLSAFTGIATHPRIFDPPTPLAQALVFCDQLREHLHRVDIVPGPRHWPLFVELCQAVGASGNLVPDAYLAALAIESDCQWVTTDRHFQRFPRLRCRHPLD